jgi:hypothetical protein
LSALAPEHGERHTYVFYGFCIPPQRSSSLWWCMRITRRGVSSRTSRAAGWRILSGIDGNRFLAKGSKRAPAALTNPDASPAALMRRPLGAD